MIKRIPLLLLFVIPMLSHAIVMRHDVDEAQYLSSEESWPGTAFFHMGGRFGSGTGTLIAPRWVLTAGHVTHYLKTGLSVSINGEQYGIREIVSHPDYVLNSPDHDIGLVYLDQPVEKVDPIPLYERQDEVGKVITFVGAGWPGTGETGTQGASGVIREAKNRVDAVRELLLIFDFDAPPDALPREGISGPGDSGGPAYWTSGGKTWVMGVSAFQGESPTGVEGVYGVREYYTRVSTHLQWIRSVIEP